jgi:hypothetical protein
MQRNARSTGGRKTRSQQRSFPRRATTLRASTGRRRTAARSRAANKASARGGRAQTPRARMAGKTTTRRTGGARTANRGARKSSTRLSGRSAQSTTDHDTIQQWVEERGGWPATVERTARGGSAGVLRIDFPGFSGQGTLRRISWDDWFDKFDDSNLAFLYVDETPEGNCSRFFKLVNRSGSRSRAKR